MTESRQRRKRQTLLSVDWDYFFPVNETGPNAGLYDWGHRENEFFIDGLIWTVRASNFLKNGLPLPGTSGDESTFWERFRFAPDATLHVAESHSHALAVGIPDTVVNYDAHHDCGYPGRSTEHFADDVVYCDDWLAYLITECGTEASVVYPKWRPWQELEKTVPVAVDRQTDDGSPRSEEFDAVFVCRSGAWTPPWLDSQFQNFVDQCPIAKENRVTLQDLTPRLFDKSEAEHFSELTDLVDSN